MQSVTAQGCESLSHRDVPNGELSVELVRIRRVQFQEGASFHASHISYCIFKRRRRAPERRMILSRRCEAHCQTSTSRRQIFHTERLDFGNNVGTGCSVKEALPGRHHMHGETWPRPKQSLGNHLGARHPTKLLGAFIVPTACCSRGSPKLRRRRILDR